LASGLTAFTIAYIFNHLVKRRIAAEVHAQARNRTSRAGNEVLSGEPMEKKSVYRAVDAPGAAKLKMKDGVAIELRKTIPRGGDWAAGPATRGGTAWYHERQEKNRAGSIVEIAATLGADVPFSWKVGGTGHRQGRRIYSLRTYGVMPAGGCLKITFSPRHIACQRPAMEH